MDVLVTINEIYFMTVSVKMTNLILHLIACLSKFVIRIEHSNKVSTQFRDQLVAPLLALLKTKGKASEVIIIHG